VEEEIIKRASWSNSKLSNLVEEVLCKLHNDTHQEHSERRARYPFNLLSG
jgi:hypothetical protein